jgi:hypothetical protein
MKELNLLAVPPGTRLRLLDGATAEVVQNPADGMWLFCRYLAHPDDPSLVDGKEHAVFAQDVDAVLPPQESQRKERA